MGYKNHYDEVSSGSTCKQGEIEAVVIATGVHTFFGKAAHLVDNTKKVGMAVEIVVMYPILKRPYRSGIDNLLVLLIGGIPIAMPDYAFRHHGYRISHAFTVER
ncbi:hypothetical protein LXL04_034320 [Taraxacum kok-saghyz]